MSERINLVSCVRAALAERNVSTVKVVNAVNSALGELERTDKPSKLGYGRTSDKGHGYKVSGSQSYTLTGKLNIALHFDAWHGAIEKANKVAEMDIVALPQVFDIWLAKMIEHKDLVPA